MTDATIEDVVNAIEDLAEAFKVSPVVNVAAPKVSVSTPVVADRKPCAYEIEITGRDSAGNIKSLRMTPV